MIGPSDEGIRQKALAIAAMKILGKRRSATPGVIKTADILATMKERLGGREAARKLKDQVRVIIIWDDNDTIQEEEL